MNIAEIRLLGKELNAVENPANQFRKMKFIESRHQKTVFQLQQKLKRKQQRWPQQVYFIVPALMEPAREQY